MGGNFNAKCLETNGYCDYTKGKIYKIRDGKFTYDNFSTMVTRIDTIEDLDRNSSATWELIEEEGENKMEDLRELIKPCYVVKLRSGVLTMAYDTQEGINFNTEDDGYINLKSLDEKLIEKYGIDNNEFDVVEIYGLYKYAQGINCSKISTKDRPLIWKREEEPIKSPTQLEIESIELEQRKLADRLAKLKEIKLNDR